MSIDDFYKVYGYTCFYKSDTGKEDEIKADELEETEETILPLYNQLVMLGE